MAWDVYVMCVVYVYVCVFVQGKTSTTTPSI
jgi:hypothetical protein